MKIKECSKCNQTKPLRDYYLLKERDKYRYKSWCKVCVRAHMRNRKKVPKKQIRTEKMIEYQRSYYRTHRKQFQRYRKEFISRHPTYWQDYYARKKAEKIALENAITEGDLYA